MALIKADRRKVWARFMRSESSKRIPTGLKKNELRLAINAIDDWLDANNASLTQAIPLPARTSLTDRQKNGLLSAIALKRFGE